MVGPHRENASGKNAKIFAPWTVIGVRKKERPRKRRLHVGMAF